MMRSKGTRGWRALVVTVGMGGLLVSGPLAAPARADFASDAGYGLLAALVNVAYIPAKIMYAGVGGLVGGLAYITTAGDIDTAQGVWSPTVGGDYVITGSMLRGDEPILFVGQTYRSNTRAQSPIADENLRWGDQRVP